MSENKKRETKLERLQRELAEAQAAEEARLEKKRGEVLAAFGKAVIADNKASARLYSISTTLVDDYGYTAEEVDEIADEVLVEAEHESAGE